MVKKGHDILILTAYSAILLLAVVLVAYLTVTLAASSLYDAIFS